MAATETIINVDPMREMVMNGHAHTAVVDSGALSTCLQPQDKQTSTCSKWAFKGQPFKAVGNKSNKSFKVALGQVAKAGKKVKANVSLNDITREGHTLPRLQHNLFSVNTLVKAEHAVVFEKDRLAVIDSKSARHIISRKAILLGFHVPKEGMWRIPSGDYNGHDAQKYGAGELFDSPTDPVSLLQNAPPSPSSDDISNVNELKT